MLPRGRDRALPDLSRWPGVQVGRQMMFDAFSLWLSFSLSVVIVAGVGLWSASR
jgi:hypothetical protein